MPTELKKFSIEKIDQDNFKKIDTHQEVTVLNIKQLQQEKTRLELEVTKRNLELTKINEILDEYNKLP